MNRIVLPGGQTLQVGTDGVLDVIHPDGRVVRYQHTDAGWEEISSDALISVSTENEGSEAQRPPFTRGEPCYTRMDCEIRVRQLDNGEEVGSTRTVVVINTDALDRHGTEIVPQGAVLKNYRKNPVVLINHWHFLLAGKCKVSIKEGRLIAVMEERDWDLDDPEIAIWFGKLKKGILRAASIGFIPLRWERIKIDPDGKDYGDNIKYRITKWELLEWSFVSVPSNYEALVTERSALPVAPDGLRLSRHSQAFIREFANTPESQVRDLYTRWHDRLADVLDDAGTPFQEPQAASSQHATQAAAPDTNGRSTGENASPDPLPSEPQAASSQHATQAAAPITADMRLELGQESVAVRATYTPETGQLTLSTADVPSDDQGGGRASTTSEHNANVARAAVAAIRALRNLQPVSN